MSNSSNSDSFNETNDEVSDVPETHANYDISSDGTDASTPTVVPSEVVHETPTHRFRVLARTDSVRLIVAEPRDSTVDPYIPPERKTKYINSSNPEEFNQFIVKALQESTFFTYDTTHLAFPFDRYRDSDLYSAFDTIRYLTISDSKGTTLRNFHGFCKIQITANSDVTFNDCEFISPEIGKAEACIEVFAHSKATFNDCIIHDFAPNQQERPKLHDGTLCRAAGVICKSSALGVFNFCTFKADDVSVVVSTSGKAEFYDCKFEIENRMDKSMNHYYVYGFNSAKISMIRCTFNEFEGGCVFIHSRSVLYASDIIASHVATGFLNVTDQSDAYIKNIDVSTTQGSGIYIVKRSRLYADNINLYNIHGNGIQFRDSTGICRNVSITGTGNPSIIVMGSSSNPIIEYCEIRDAMNTAIGIRNGARPVFNHLLIFGCHDYSIKAIVYASAEFYDVSFIDCEFPLFHLEYRSDVYIKNVHMPSMCIDNQLRMTNMHDYVPNHETYHIRADRDCTLAQDTYYYSVYVKVRETTIDKSKTNIKDLSHPSRSFNVWDHTHVPGSYTQYTFTPCIDMTEESMFQSVGVSYLMCFDIDAMTNYVWPHGPDHKPNRFNHMEECSSVVGDIADFVIHVRHEAFNRKDDNRHRPCTNCTLMTNLNQQDMYVYIPCGHQICMTCKENRQDRIGTPCPTCKSDIKAIERVYMSSSDCVVCLDKESTTVLYPCRHVCMCVACTMSVMDDKGRCPMCNEQIRSMTVLRMTKAFRWKKNDEYDLALPFQPTDTLQ